MEERDLVEVDVAVIPGRALNAGYAFGRLGQEVADVDPGGLHEQMHHRGQVHAVGGDDVVVVDVEGEGEVVAAPALHVQGVVWVEQRRRRGAVDRAVDQAHLVLVASVVVEGGRLGNSCLRRVERPVPAQRPGRRGAELVGGLDHQPRAVAGAIPRVASLLPTVGHLPPGASLRQIDPVTGPVGQRAELGLQRTAAVMDEAEQVAVDVADIERHRLGTAAQRDTAVVIGEQQQGAAGSVGGVLGLELVGQHVDRPQRSGGPELGGIVAAEEVGGAAGEPAAAQLVIL